MNNPVSRALNGIRNGESDYQIARDIFANASRANSIPAARFADDFAEAFGGPAGASSKDQCADIVTRAPDSAKAIRAIASFGAMAAELRRLQDSEESLKRSESLLASRLEAAQAEALALESTVSEHAKAGACQRERLAAYRDAAAQFTFAELRDGGQRFRALFAAFDSDVKAEAAAERGDA